MMNLVVFLLMFLTWALKLSFCLTTHMSLLMFDCLRPMAWPADPAGPQP